MIWAVVWLVALAVVVGMLAPQPHKASGSLFSLTVLAGLVSGLVLAINAL